MTPGVTVNIPANVKHWHGAARNSATAPEGVFMRLFAFSSLGFIVEHLTVFDVAFVD